MRLNANQKRLVDLGFRLLEEQADAKPSEDGKKPGLDPASVALVKEMRLALWGDVRIVSQEKTKETKPKTAPKDNPVLSLAK